MTEKKCSSCGALVTNDDSATSFPCPKCGNEKIIRCGKCRKTSVAYECSKCKFRGP